MKFEEIMEVIEFLDTKDYKSIVESVKYIEAHLNLSGKYSERIIELFNKNNSDENFNDSFELFEDNICEISNNLDIPVLEEGEADEYSEKISMIIPASEQQEIYIQYDEEKCLSNRFSIKNDLNLIFEELVNELENCHEYDSALEYIKNIAFNKEIINATLSERTGIAESTISRIFNNNRKIANKEMAIKLCIGLDLDYDESRDVLLKLGYSVDTEFKRDKIFKYCLDKKYNIYDVEEVLYEFNEEGWLKSK